MENSPPKLINPYRSPEGNTRYLRALFWEEAPDKSTVLYTLKDRDHKGYPSLYRLYMEMQDLTEISFARKYFESWEHWQMVCQCEWFIPYITRWREELELETRAMALAAIKDEAMSTSKNSFQANKFLLQGGWKKEDPQEPKRRGRPSKEDINKAADKLAKGDTRLIEDFKRLGLHS